MRAVITTTPGGPETLRFAEVPDPDLKAGELLIRVKAAALNRADLLQRAGFYPAPPGIRPDILGLEFAGEVIGTPSPESRFKPGDRVMGLLGGAAQAELVASPEGLLLPIPPDMTFELASAVPEAFLTAYDALFSQASVGPGESVLIHAVGSGVGTAALQLARLAGCLTLGTSRSREKLEGAKVLGLNHAILTGEPVAFADEVLAITDGTGVDAALDLVGGAYFDESLRALSLRGRLVQIGITAGSSASLDLGLLMRKRLRLFGTVLRGRPLHERVALTQRFGETALKAFARGQLSPIVDRVFPASEVQAAHELLGSNGAFGKLVLRF
jgi:NADPH2:quinone reductase